MNIKHEIDELTAAVQAQCGMLASVKHLHHTSGVMVTVVQVCVSEEPDQWEFFEARDAAGMTRIRDELADFIAANRQEAA